MKKLILALLLAVAIGFAPAQQVEAAPITAKAPYAQSVTNAYNSYYKIRVVDGVFAVMEVEPGQQVWTYYSSNVTVYSRSFRIDRDNSGPKKYGSCHAGPRLIMNIKEDNVKIKTYKYRGCKNKK